MNSPMSLVICFARGLDGGRVGVSACFMVSCPFGRLVFSGAVFTFLWWRWRWWFMFDVLDVVYGMTAWHSLHTVLVLSVTRLPSLSFLMRKPKYCQTYDLYPGGASSISTSFDSMVGCLGARQLVLMLIIFVSSLQCCYCNMRCLDVTTYRTVPRI